MRSVAVFVCAVSSGHAAVDIPALWHGLIPVIEARAAQEKSKMKLFQQDIADLVIFFKACDEPVPHLLGLQAVLPKTTLELVRSVVQRGVPLKEADRMARYLAQLVYDFQFENISAFDENSSHIVGREWHEIDYSGEGMTWQAQKRHYAPYGICNFKSEELLRKFFSIESTYPYFTRIYRPHASLFRRPICDRK